MLLSNPSIIKLTALLLMFVGLSVSLKCYICHTDSNSLCGNDTLKDCPSNQAYDRCMTTIYRKPKDGLHIKKECALAPCHLRDQKLSNLLSFEQSCSNSKEDRCIHCCSTDGCNIDGVSQTKAHNILISLMLFTILTIPLVLLQF